MFKSIQQQIVGNIVPVPAQFNRDLSLNLEGYREHVKFLLEKGVSVFYLALSASEFDYMTSKERVLVTETVSQIVKGKGIVLAQAVGTGWLDDQMVEARKMIDAGADAIVVKPVGIKEGGKFFSCKYKRGSYSPERHDQYFVDYVNEFAEKTGAPMVYHDKPFSSGHGLTMEGLQRIVEIENVVCIKLHVPDPCVMQTVYSEFGSKIACYDGFGKTLQFWSLIWGASARHTCWSWFDPENDKIFFESVKGKRFNKAIEIMNREWPLAHVITQTGFAGYKEVMNYMGLPGGPVRIPGENLSETDRKIIAAAVKEIGLLP